MWRASGPERRSDPMNAAWIDQSSLSDTPTGLSFCLTMTVAISPADRSQHGPHTRDRTDKQQHGESNHQEKCGSHVVQNRDHTTSLLLLDRSAAPPTGTNPWTHWINLLKGSPATGALASPYPPHLPTEHYSCTRSLPAISEKPVHKITLSPAKCRSRSASGPCLPLLGLASTYPPPIVKIPG